MSVTAHGRVSPSSLLPRQQRASRREALRAEIARRRKELIRRSKHELRARKRELAKRKLLPFIEWTHPDYEAGWFHRVLCERLERFSEQVANGENPRLIICAPPRHGKTAIVSQRFPVWHMARNPRHEIAVASYAQELADDNSRVAREVARSPEAHEVFEDIRPQKKQKTFYADYKRQNIDKISMWSIGNESSYKAVGVGGPLTGRGAHVLIIDDPVKDAAEALSATKRQAAWDWFGPVSYTRVAPGGGIIVMATRWHDDDLIGRIIAQDKASGKHRWEVLNFEAIATQDEEHRKAGEALHPERWSLDDLEERKDILGPTWFSAMFQGNPIPDGGNKINPDHIARYTASPFAIAAEADEVWITSDTAQKAKASNDLHSLQCWARTGRRYTMLDRVSGRMEYPAYEAAMNAMREKWRSWLTGTYIEDTANGATYIQLHRHEGGIHDFLPRRDTPGSDKSKPARFKYVERASSGRQLEIPAATHDVPGLGPSAQEWLTFICAFPSEPDDDADATSQLIMKWELEAREAESASSVLNIAKGTLSALRKKKASTSSPTLPRTPTPTTRFPSPTIPSARASTPAGDAPDSPAPTHGCAPQRGAAPPAEGDPMSPTRPAAEPPAAEPPLGAEPSSSASSQASSSAASQAAEPPLGAEPPPGAEPPSTSKPAAKKRKRTGPPSFRFR